VPEFVIDNNGAKHSNLGGHDNWDPAKYLNIWVCQLGGGLLGYATFPADLTSEADNDGVVIGYTAFGNIGTVTAPYNKGRTATHEVGHWLNLRHVWGDANCGDDFVDDTPTQEKANYGCTSFPHVTCGNGPNGDLFIDFMDYSDDACMAMFTNGQKQRTDATFAGPRNGLTTSAGCGLVGIDDPISMGNLLAFPNPTAGLFRIKNPAGYWSRPVVEVRDLLGKTVPADTRIVSYTEVDIAINHTVKGLYIVSVRENNKTWRGSIVVE
jgi:hypothetical protein